jgi:hypothetical protein
MGCINCFSAGEQKFDKTPFSVIFWKETKYFDVKGAGITIKTLKI